MSARYARLRRKAELVHELRRLDGLQPRKIAEAIFWIHELKRIGNIAAAARWERHLLAMICMLVIACSGDTFTPKPFIELDGGTESSGEAGDPLEDASGDAGDIRDGFPDVSPLDSAPDAPDAKPLCPDPNDVAYGGHCFYLDGSKGVCDGGYTLSSNAKLAAILGANANAWQGKNYRHTVSDNSCVLTKDNVENYGMTSHANLPGPFSAGEPVANGGSCWMISPPNMQPKQLTLCESL